MGEEKVSAVEQVLKTALDRPIAVLMLILAAIGVGLSVAVTVNISNAPPYVFGFRAWRWTNVIAYCLAVVPALLLVVAKKWKSWRPQISSAGDKTNEPGSPPAAAIKTLAGRKTYSETLANEIARAKSRVYLVMHTLVSSMADSSVSRLQDLLRDRCSAGCDVRLLAPVGPDRLEASSELRRKGIPIRHLAFLEDDDLRFGLIDSDTVIVGVHADKRTGRTSDALAIKSVRLASLLAAYFDAYWHHPGALSFVDYARTEITKLVDPSNPPTVRTLAERLGITEKEALTAMTDAEAGLCPGIVVFVGRPCAGKSTAARIVRSELLRAGYPHSIDIRSDYRLLHKWSRSPDHSKAFEVTEFDGFRVRDFLVLDEVLRQLRAEISGAQSHLHLVEFARADYRGSLETLAVSDPIAVVHVDAAPEVCKRRNSERQGTRLSPDSGYVPKDIMDNHYKDDGAGSLRESLGERFVHVTNSSDDPIALAAQLRAAVVAKLLSVASATQDTVQGRCRL